MKVAIISDVHNNEVNLQKVLDYCGENEVKEIVCCGDLASESTLDFINENFDGKIHYTFGNMDSEQLMSFEFREKYKNTRLYKDFGEALMGIKKIAFVHYPNIAESLCETGKYDYVFYGHTHKPWEKITKKCKMLNPGNVAGELYPPTFAIWNTKDGMFKLIRIHELK